MSHLCLVLPIWKRHVLTAHILNYYASIKVPNVTTTVVVVGSEGGQSKRLARGLEYVEFPNKLLDAKFDAGIHHCRSFRPDATCLIGSDDFISPQWFSWAMQNLEAGVDLVGLLDMHVYDYQTDRAYYWPGYGEPHHGRPIGSGKVYSKRVLDKLDWAPYGREMGYRGYEDDDQRSEKAVELVGGKSENYNMAFVNAEFWTIKTGFEFNHMATLLPGLTDITEHNRKCFDLLSGWDLPRGPQEFRSL